MTANKPELLAPAGSYAAFLAAVHAGANAVYLAGKQYGARATAENFTLEEIETAVNYAHLRDVRIYVTVNTLLKEQEMAAAVRYAAQLYNLGIDALIVQDWGLIAALQENLPHLPLYASTQITLHNTSGCLAAKEWGLSRVILAREVSLADMAKISKQSPLPIESFVHGALCVCYSGQCLFSSMVGGRSGNRGRCAQPCRLKYQLQKDGQAADEAAHLLSPKDLRGIELLDDLAAAGVSSLKIEGRMKRPEYVATVVSAYAAGQEGYTAEVQQSVEQAFNREFTTGYLESNQGADLMSYSRPNNRGVRLGRLDSIGAGKAVLALTAPVQVGDGVEVWVTKGGRQGFTITEMLLDGVAVQSAQAGQKVTIPYYGYAVDGDRVFKTLDIALNTEAQALMTPRTMPLYMDFTARLGEQPQISCRDEAGHSVTLNLDFIVPLAQKHVSDYDAVKSKLERLGGSNWHLAEFNCQLDEGIMLPSSVLNEGRRQAVLALEAARCQSFARTQLAEIPRLKAADSAKKSACPSKLAVFTSDLASAIGAAQAGADILYIGGENFWGIKSQSSQLSAELFEQGVPVYYVLPNIFLESETEHYRRLIERLAQMPISGVLVGNAGMWQLLREQTWQKEIIGDFGLNIINSWAATAWTARGLERVALSYEMNFQEIEALAGSFRRECLLGGNLQVMVSEHCALGALQGGKTQDNPCSRPCSRDAAYSLKDGKGFTFPLAFDKNCRMHIFNGHQLCLLEDMPRFLAAGVDVLRLDLRFYHEGATAKTVAAYSKVLRELRAGYAPEMAVYKEKIAACALGALTKGHYYRGTE